MQITATMVKDLRTRTGAGMMDCKKTLLEAEGDMERAIDLLRKSGQIKAEKKSDRIAAEGVVKIIGSNKNYAIVEVNCETDFVARDEQFLHFVDYVAQRVLGYKLPHDTLHAELSQNDIGDTSIEEKRLGLISKIGENIQIRRIIRIILQGDTVASYIHSRRIGVLVDMQGGDTIAKDIAMHIAASHPLCISEADVPAEKLQKEKQLLTEQAQESGKPTEIIEKMVMGRLKKFISEISLSGQPFVKDTDKTVGGLLKEHHAKVNAFYRYEVGEGIEKRQENFADEVMAQLKASEA